MPLDQYGNEPYGQRRRSQQRSRPSMARGRGRVGRGRSVGAGPRSLSDFRVPGRGFGGPGARDLGAIGAGPSGGAGTAFTGLSAGAGGIHVPVNPTVPGASIYNPPAQPGGGGGGLPGPTSLYDVYRDLIAYRGGR